MSIEIYEVQSAALADGIYTCYKQKLLATGWQAGHGNKFANAEETPVPVEVFNLEENDTIGSYTPALAIGDKIAAWPVKDCSGESRLVGIPLVPASRRARLCEDIGSSQSVHCNLIANDGETEIAEGLGSNILAHYDITFNSNLDAAEPRLHYDAGEGGDYISLVNRQGDWRGCQTLTGTEDCVNE